MQVGLGYRVIEDYARSAFSIREIDQIEFMFEKRILYTN
jgi:hypothetical protein